MEQITLKINGIEHMVEVPSDMPLLWALRDMLNLTGTKYSCGIGECGSCMVLVDGRAVKSCVLPAVRMQGREITTIEGRAAVRLLPGRADSFSRCLAGEKPEAGQCGDR
jgi:aerobic-type carbon monoxide dehydrogenase small subunit (CoxS/CutS family)